MLLVNAVALPVGLRAVTSDAVDELSNARTKVYEVVLAVQLVTVPVRVSAVDEYENAIPLYVETVVAVVDGPVTLTVNDTVLADDAFAVARDAAVILGDVNCNGWLRMC